MDNMSELKVEDVNRSYEQKKAHDSDEYWKRRNERRNGIRKKKVDSMKKKIKRSVYAASVVSLLAIGKLLSQKENQSEGANYIINKFNERTEEYDKIGVVTVGDSVSVTRTNHVTGKTDYIEPIEGIIYLDTVGKNEGFSDVERYIIENDKFLGFYRDEIDARFSDVNRVDVIKAKEALYHESKLEDAKGVSR